MSISTFRQLRRKIFRWQYTAQGLPPGASITRGGFYGSSAPGDADNSPYHVTLTATDGIYSAQTTFTWNITAPLLVLGDLNRDGQTGAADVGSLMTALSDPTKYQSTAHLSPAEFRTVADVNGDRVVNNFDVQALITLIANKQAGGGAFATSAATVGSADSTTAAPVDESPTIGSAIAAPSVSVTNVRGTGLPAQPKIEFAFATPTLNLVNADKNNTADVDPTNTGAAIDPIKLRAVDNFYLRFATHQVRHPRFMHQADGDFSSSDDELIKFDTAQE